MRGRKPIPTELKILTGNPGKRPLNDREPQASGRPTCPPHLKDEAKKEWGRVCRELTAMGILGRIDRGALAAYCQAWARWVKAEETIAQTGMVLKSADGGYYQNPYLAVANRAMEQMTSLAAEFGMTPSSRSRVKVVKKEANGQGKSRFFAG